MAEEQQGTDRDGDVFNTVARKGPLHSCRARAEHKLPAREEWVPRPEPVYTVVKSGGRAFAGRVHWLRSHGASQGLWM